MTSLGRRLIKAANEGVAIVRRRRRRRYTLEELLVDLEPQKETDWGPPRGREVIEEYVDKSHLPSKK